MRSFQIGRKRRGAGFPQLPIGVQRIAFKARAETLCQVDLVTVAGVDVPLDAVEGVAVIGFALLRMEGRL